MTHSPLIPGFNWDFQNSCGYGTHQPVLYEAIKRSTLDKFPILELGCGQFSTDLIHRLAKDRQIISVDSDAGWLDSCRKIHEGPTHEFKLCSFEEMSTFTGIFSVIFVDQGLWESRLESIKAYKNNAEFVVLHDSDYLVRELGVNFSDYYKYHKTFMPLQPYPYVTGPPTTILSNFSNVTRWEINYEDYK